MAVNVVGSMCFNPTAGSNGEEVGTSSVNIAASTSISNLPTYTESITTKPASAIPIHARNSTAASSESSSVAASPMLTRLEVRSTTSSSAVTGFSSIPSSTLTKELWTTAPVGVTLSRTSSSWSLESGGMAGAAGGAGGAEVLVTPAWLDTETPLLLHPKEAAAFYFEPNTESYPSDGYRDFENNHFAIHILRTRGQHTETLHLTLCFWDESEERFQISVFSFPTILTAADACYTRSNAKLELSMPVPSQPENDVHWKPSHVLITTLGEFLS